MVVPWFKIIQDLDFRLGIQTVEGFDKNGAHFLNINFKKVKVQFWSEDEFVRQMEYTGLNSNVELITHLDL